MTAGTRRYPSSRWVLAVVLSGAVTAAASTIQPLLIADFIDRILGHRPVAVVLGLIGIAIAALLVSELVSKVVRARWVRALRDRWRELLLDRFAARASDESDIVSRSNNDVEAVVESFHLGRVELLLSVLGLVMAGFGLGRLSPIFLLLVAGCAIVMLVLPILFRRHIASRKITALEQAKSWNGLLITTVRAAATFRRRGAFLLRLGTVGQASRTATRSTLRAETYEGVIDIAIGAVLFVHQFLIILVGWLLIRADAISVGELVAALQYEELLLVPLLSLTDSLTDIAGGKQIANALVGASADDEETADGSPAAENGAPAPGTVLVGPDSDVRVPLGDGGTVLRVPPLHVSREDLVVVTGLSGTGKTTLLRLLAGELGSRGAIGTEQGEDLRVAYLPAEEPAFPESFAYDVDLGREVTPETLRGATQMVDSTAGRISDMSARGTSVGASLGERQRIALARVLIDPPDIILLDEALGHLDRASAERLIGVLHEDLGLGVVMVRHEVSDIDVACTQRWHLSVAEDEHRVEVSADIRR